MSETVQEVNHEVDEVPDSNPPERLDLEADVKVATEVQAAAGKPAMPALVAPVPVLTKEGAEVPEGNPAVVDIDELDLTKQMLLGERVQSSELALRLKRIELQAATANQQQQSQAFRNFLEYLSKKYSIDVTRYQIGEDKRLHLVR